MTIGISQPVYSDHRAIIGGRSVKFIDPKAKFDALAETWDEENLGMSTSNYQHPAYLQIIGMGAAAVPMLLDRLRRGERRWVYALKFITGEQPDTAEMKGNAEQVIRAWLTWGTQHGWDLGKQDWNTFGYRTHA